MVASSQVNLRSQAVYANPLAQIELFAGAISVWLAADVVAMSTSTVSAPEVTSSGRVGMWMFLGTDAMGFGAMLLAYGVLRVHADAWPDARDRLDIGQTAGMTFALLASSLTMTMAVLAARDGRGRARAAWLAATVALGAAFLGGQAAEYARLLSGPRRMGLTTDAFASTFYALTGFHGAHVLAGVILLGALLGRRATGV